MSVLKRIFLGFIIIAIAITAAFYTFVYPHYTIPIMMYHSVNDIRVTSEANTTSRETFERHMDYLRRHGYRIISLNDYIFHLQSKEPLPHNAVIVTFDDGYADNYTVALPILQKYKIPATFFVSSDLIDTDGYMTWEELREAGQKGLDIGSHTRYHTYLPDLDSDKKFDAIVTSKRVLEEHLKTEVGFFAYPSGGFDEESQKLVVAAGYKAACTTNRGRKAQNKDLYALNRIRFGENDDNPFALWAKLSGYYNFFRKQKSPC